MSIDTPEDIARILDEGGPRADKARLLMREPAPSTLASLRLDLAFLLDDGPEHAADPASHAAHASEVAALRAEIEALEKAEQEAASKAGEA